MKRIVSFICMIAVLCTMFVPIVSTKETSAAATPWYTGWKVSKGTAYVTDKGTVRIPDGSEYSFTYSGRPSKYTIEFSINVINWSNSVGLQGLSGGFRPGGYVRDGYVGSMSGGYRVATESGTTGWHDYKFEVDYEQKVQKIYYDGIYVGEFALDETGHTGDTFRFWASSGGEIEVDAAKFYATTASGVQTETPTVPAIGYTPGFFEDYNDIDDVVITGGEYFTHDKENGILSMYREKVAGITTAVEKPLKPPKNFDVEWRLRFAVVDKPGLTPGEFKVEVSMDNRHTWVAMNTGGFGVKTHGENWVDPFYEGPQQGMVFYPEIQRGEWFTMKGEFRDTMVTWYIDGERVIEYEVYKSRYNQWHTQVSAAMAQGQSGGFDIDWHSYTPYFDDELTMVTPATNSKVVTGSDIRIKADTTLETEKIDYYINSTYIGSGYKKDDYAYTLKDAKIGSYHIVAKVGEVETCETDIKVVEGYETKGKLSKEKIKYGETVKFTAEVEALYDAYKPVKAEFFVNGKLYQTDKSAPFETTVSGLRIGTNAISARLYDKLGFMAEVEPKNVDVEYVKGKKFEIGREYELNYEYKSGNGKIHLNDGYFDLSITHKKDGITFVSDEGTETYNNIGYGDYKIVVTAGHAELYWKNQFLKSIRLPYKPGNADFSNSGISGLKLSGSGVKTEILGHKWNGEKEYESGNLPIEKKYLYSLEFDKTDTSEEEVYVNDGRYTATIYFREDGIYVKRQLTLSSEPTELKLYDEVKPGYYRLTMGYGLGQLTLNNVPLGDFRAILHGSKKEIKRTMTNPKASTFIALKNWDDVYYHNDDFEDTAELPSEEYWQQGPSSFRTGSEKMTVTRKTEGKNHYMSLDGSGVYMLNATDKYPSMKWRGRVDKKSGRVFAVLRQATNQQHTKIGYDFNTESWFFEILDYSGKLIKQESKSAPGALQMGKWYDFEVVAKDFEVSLLVNGKEAFKKDIGYDFTVIMFGRMGVGVKNSAYSFDDFCYVGEGRATPGARCYSAPQFAGIDIGAYPNETKNPNSLGVAFYTEDKEDGTVYGISTSIADVMLITKDKGKSWQRAEAGEISTDSTYVRAYAYMPNGTMVGIVGGNTVHGKPQYSVVSQDGGKTWSQQYMIHSGAYGYSGTTGLCSSTSNGRVFFVCDSGIEGYGICSVFYSDDGMNWKVSNPEYIEEKDTGVTMQECMVVETPRENEVWLYGRSNTGYLVYLKSFDNGVTWDLTPHMSGLIHPEAAWSIVRDKDNPNTYYASYLYDAQTAFESRKSMPRNRASLAVSYDGMETWEYVSDLISNSSVPGNVLGDLHVYNLGGQLYWKTDCRPGRQAMGVQDISKIKSLKRLPVLQHRYMFAKETIAGSAQDHCVVSKDNKTAWVYGSYCDADVRDRRVNLELVENIFGVTAVKSGNTITLKFGDGKVVFREGSSEYDDNGVKKTAECVVLSGGYLDLKVLSEIYGKNFRETENSYTVLDGAVEFRYQEGIDNLA